VGASVSTLEGYSRRRLHGNLPISAVCSRIRPHRMCVMASLAIPSDESRPSDPVHFLGERLVRARAGGGRIARTSSMYVIASFPARSGPDVSCIPIWGTITGSS
jgi:hypothetical protein